jgi:23S rRNA (pseudouridine1915-N3)-methyltransferase
MYYDQITAEQWTSLKPYLDTCLLPVASLKGSDDFWEMKERLNGLSLGKKWVEQMYSGRIVIYPDICYSDVHMNGSYVNEWIQALKEKGFRYIVLLDHADGFQFEADAILSIAKDGEPLSDEIKNKMQQTILNMWEVSKGKDTWDTD